jgi:hypothetical protein
MSVSVIAVLALTMAAALLVGLLKSLLALSILIPLCGGFFARDSRIVDNWRASVLQAWVARDLDLVAYKLVICANPALPQTTVEGMLATLPLADGLTDEQALSTSTRQAVAATACATYRVRTDAVVYNALGALCALSASAVFLAGGMRVASWVLLGLAAVPPVYARVRGSRLVETKREFAESGWPDTIDAKECSRLIRQLK